jgi:MFS family permease
VLLYRAFPESPKFLAAYPARAGELAALLTRLSATSSFVATQRFLVAAEDPGRRPGIAALLEPQYRRVTLLLWTVFFVNVFVVYLLWSWLPTVLSNAGLPIGAAIRGVQLLNLGGVIASIVASFSVNRLGTRRVIAITASMSLLGSLATGQAALFSTPGSAPDATLLYVWLTLMGAGLSGTQVMFFVVASQYYPTPLRGTGLGAAGTWSRFGGILSAAGGAGIFAWGIGGTALFTGLAVVLAVPLAVGISLPNRGRAPISEIAAAR